jgi:mono/diheme cytochrome c family protein
VTVALLAGGGLLIAQQLSDTLPPGKNPHLGNKASVRSGLTLYRVRCGDCHGLDARGYRGPDLTAILGGMPDERLFQAIRKGVPGTEMPRSTVPDDDVLMIIADLRDMSSAGVAEPASGTSTTAPAARIVAAVVRMSSDCVDATTCISSEMRG